MKEFVDCTDYSQYVLEEGSPIYLAIRSHSPNPVSSEEAQPGNARACWYIEVFHNGAVRFLDYEKQLLAFADASQSLYKQMQFRWEPTGPSVKFGYYDEVDYYPHCDGEHDRWGIQWMTQRQVSLNEAESSVTVK